MTEQPPMWASSYIGIAYADLGRSKEDGLLDCWGLVRVVIQERTGIVLPEFATVSESDYRAVSGEINGAKKSEDWISIPHGEEKELDVAEMVAPTRQDTRVSFLPLHVGIVVCQGWVLHTEAATGSRLSSYHDQRTASRIIGFWRHRLLT